VLFGAPLAAGRGAHPKGFDMSLVKKNRIDHFKRNKKNIKKRVKEFAEQAKRLNADKKAFAAEAKKK
jgi:hypothetical protein